MNADEHVKNIVGALLAHYILEVAVLRAEVDRLKAELAPAPANGGAPARAKVRAP